MRVLSARGLSISLGRRWVDERGGTDAKDTPEYARLLPVGDLTRQREARTEHESEGDFGRRGRGSRASRLTNTAESYGSTRNRTRRAVDQLERRTTYRNNVHRANARFGLSRRQARPAGALQRARR